MICLYKTKYGVIDKLAQTIDRFKLRIFCKSRYTTLSFHIYGDFNQSSIQQSNHEKFSV